MSESGDLQFQTAEFLGRKCTLCQSGIDQTYYQIQGRDACPACAEAQVQLQNQTDSADKTMRALLWGSGAALLGAAGFAIVAMIGLRLAILSIGVGWLVGRAIKKGTAGYSSRKYQVMAVVLTYLAIATSYVPLVMSAMARMPGGSPGFSLELIGRILILPVTSGLYNLPMGLLTLLINFFGLQQAWKQTAESVALVAGPYRNSAPA